MRSTSRTCAETSEGTVLLSILGIVEVYQNVTSNFLVTCKCLLHRQNSNQRIEMARAT